MSKKNEFGEVKPKPPQQIPYDSPKHPKELSEVDKSDSPKVSFNLSDYFRLLWMYFLHDAEEKLNPVEKLKVEKFLSWGAIGLFALVIIVVLVRSYLF